MLMQPDRAVEVMSHGVDRVEGSERVLEDELHLALVVPECPAGPQLDRLAIEADRA